MGARDRIYNQIKKKQAEIDGLKATLRDAEVYLAALNDAIRYVQKDQNGSDAQPHAETLKAGSNLAKVQDIIKKHGKPMHIVEILKSLGKPVTKSSKVSLAGSLASYARNGRVFVKTDPNTYGIEGMSSANRVPEDFGLQSEEKLSGK